VTARHKSFARPSGGVYADLHLHSNQSDGTDPPAQVVSRAVAAGLNAMALTDHDTTAGNNEAAEAAAGEGITFIPGVEVSAEFDRVEVHILGLGITRESEEFEARLAEIRSDRITRVELMIQKLRDLDINITPEDTAAEIGETSSPGRLHVARALYRIGVTKSIQEAFTRFIGLGRPAYVPKKRIPANEAIELIHGGGGLASIAHPGIGGVHKKLRSLLSLPFDAIEVWHAEHNAGQSAEFAIAVSENGLIATGGSDDHGSKTQRKNIGRTGLNETDFKTFIQRLEQSE
jgi:hypothetical protein